MRVRDLYARLCDDDARVSHSHALLYYEDARGCDNDGRLSHEEARLSDEEARRSRKEARLDDEEARRSRKEARLSDEEARLYDKHGRLSDEEARRNGEEARVYDKHYHRTGEESRLGEEQCLCGCGVAPKSNRPPLPSGQMVKPRSRNLNRVNNLPKERLPADVGIGSSGLSSSVALRNQSHPGNTALAKLGAIDVLLRLAKNAKRLFNKEVIPTAVS